MLHQPGLSRKTWPRSTGQVTRTKSGRLGRNHTADRRRHQSEDQTDHDADDGQIGEHLDHADVAGTVDLQRDVVEFDSGVVWPGPTMTSNSSKAATMAGIASPSKVISYVLRDITLRSGLEQ